MSAIIRDDIARSRTPVRERMWFGEFAADVAGLTSLASVIVPDYDTTLHWANCMWQPRGTLLPVKGNPCLVSFDNRNQPWIVAWWPY